MVWFKACVCTRRDACRPKGVVSEGAWRYPKYRLQGSNDAFRHYHNSGVIRSNASNQLKNSYVNRAKISWSKFIELGRYEIMNLIGA